MHRIAKRIVTDEDNRPIAVQIDYVDWLEIERRLDLESPPRKVTDLSAWQGLLKLSEDPLEYQRRIREEWP